jgi:hypothetical protein
MSTTVAEDHAKYERLRYVTENFQALQGLTLVCMGGWLFFSEAEDIPGVVPPWWLKLLTLLALGLYLAALRYIPRYYERRFGSVEWRVRRVSPIDIKSLVLQLVFVVLLLVVLLFGLAGGRYLNWAHRMLSDPDHRANLPPVLYWFAFLCAWASNRSHFGRLHMVLFSAYFLILWTGVSVFLPLRHPEVTQQTLWRILNAGWLGISLMLMGLYNHLTLVRLLPRRGRTNDNE